MILLYGYLAIGVAVLAIVFVSRWRIAKHESASLRDLLDPVHPDRKKLPYRILNRIVAPIVAAVVVMLFWPVAAYMSARKIFWTANESALEEERAFSVERAHLQKRLTVQEIEAREMVDDPLGAAPNVPFGHLNATWCSFLQGCADGDELWSFTARWRTTWGREELRSGYALVRHGTPAAYFLTVWKDLPEEDESR